MSLAEQPLSSGSDTAPIMPTCVITASVILSGLERRGTPIQTTSFTGEVGEPDHRWDGEDDHCCNERAGQP